MALAIMRAMTVRLAGMMLAAVSTPLAWAVILPVPDVLLERHCRGIGNSYECAQRIEAGEIQNKHATRVSRCRPKSLCIRLAHKSMTLKDKGIDTNQVVAYSYLAFAAALKLHVV